MTTLRVISTAKSLHQKTKCYEQRQYKISHCQEISHHGQNLNITVEDLFYHPPFLGYFGLSAKNTEVQKYFKLG